MSNALRDQLLKAGLTDNKKVKAIKKEQHKQKKQSGKKQPVINEATLLAEQKRQQQIERDRQLNQQKQAELEKRAIAAQVKQLIEQNRIPHQGDIAFNFVDEKRVKRIYVTQKLHDEISRGLLAIIRQSEHYSLVPAQIADKIQQRQPETIILLNQRQQQENNDSNDDPYAEYQIPDDLMW